MPPTADSSASLIDLANQKFGQITDAEKTLFAALERQEVAKFQADAVELNAPASAEQWGAERTLKADRLVWLVTTRHPEQLNGLAFEDYGWQAQKLKASLTWTMPPFLSR
jgi:hypothetical protein